MPRIGPDYDSLEWEEIFLWVGDESHKIGEIAKTYAPSYVPYWRGHRLGQFRSFSGAVAAILSKEIKLYSDVEAHTKAKGN